MNQLSLDRLASYNSLRENNQNVSDINRSAISDVQATYYPGRPRVYGAIIKQRDQMNQTRSVQKETSSIRSDINKDNRHFGGKQYQQQEEITKQQLSSEKLFVESSPKLKEPPDEIEIDEREPKFQGTSVFILGLVSFCINTNPFS